MSNLWMANLLGLLGSTAGLGASTDAQQANAQTSNSAAANYYQGNPKGGGGLSIPRDPASARVPDDLVEYLDQELKLLPAPAPASTDWNLEAENPDD